MKKLVFLFQRLRGELLLMEWLDVVNDRDQVIDTGLRELVHQQGLRHRASHLIIYNKDSIFLQLRHEQKNQFPNCWDISVSGHVNSGETYLECILRETKEELGISCNNSLAKIAYYSACAANGWEFSCLYKMFQGYSSTKT